MIESAVKPESRYRCRDRFSVNSAGSLPHLLPVADDYLVRYMVLISFNMTNSIVVPILFTEIYAIKGLIMRKGMLSAMCHERCPRLIPLDHLNIISYN